AEVGAALEQVRREGVAEQVRVDALRLEPRDLREPAQDEEDAGSCERAALRVQEELRPVAPVEVRPPARQVAPQRLGRLTPDRDDALLAALADDADEPRVEVRRVPVEADRLGDAQARAV